MPPKKTSDAANKKASSKIGIRGERVRSVRLKHGWRQFELAQRSNIPPPALSRVELGHKDLNALLVIAFATVLQVTSDYLLGLSSDSTRK